MTAIPRDSIKSLFVASDHAGYAMKQDLQQLLPELPWVDLGPTSTDSVDYPDFADSLSKRINEDNQIGILICGSGQGMAIRANRHSHIRAALCWNEEITRLSRLHNNANVLCLGGRMLDVELASRLVLVFLNTAFEGGRHQVRVEKLSR